MNIISLGLGQTASQFLGFGFTPGASTGASAAEVWNYVLSNGKSAKQNVVEIHAMISELYLIHGLKLGSPLTVSTTNRQAGAVDQVVAQVGDTVTVTRQ